MTLQKCSTAKGQRCREDGLAGFIRILEDAGELARINVPVSPHLEMTEINDRVVKSGGKALLFEQTGLEFPVLLNAFGSEKRMCLALGLTSLDEGGNRFEETLQLLKSSGGSWIKKIRLFPSLIKLASLTPALRKRKGKCQEVIMDPVDLHRLPILTCWPADGGPYITLPMVHTQDPETGIRNVGMYRMQVYSHQTTGMHWQLHKGATRHFHAYQQLHRKMPVTVTLGGDPIYAYAATAPLPPEIDEYLFAGFLRKKKVNLVKCLTNNLEVPEDVDFVIEGFVDPEEPFKTEGPFGDHTGFYSLPDAYPVFHVTCITHRRHAVYPATVVGIPPQEDAWLGKATERLFLKPIQTTILPELKDMDLPVQGGFHNITIAAIRSGFPGHAFKAMNALWGAGQMMFNKILIITGDHINIHDYREIFERIACHVDPARDIIMIPGPLDVLDHAGNQFAFGSKMGIDGTRDSYQLSINSYQQSIAFDEAGFLKLFPEVKVIRDEWVKGGIPLIVAGIEKPTGQSARDMAVTMVKSKHLSSIKFFILVDTPAALLQWDDIAWLVSANLDPIRDCRIAQNTMIIDGTTKTPENDGFSRDWPNIIVSSQETIDIIDQKWASLGIGPYVLSPSLKYRRLVTNNSAYRTRQ